MTPRDFGRRVRPRSEPLSPRFPPPRIPLWWVKWIAVPIDEGLHIRSEVRIDGRGRLLGEWRYDLRQFAPLGFGRSQHCDGLLV